MHDGDARHELPHIHSPHFTVPFGNFGIAVTRAISALCGITSSCGMGWPEIWAGRSGLAQKLGWPLRAGPKTGLATGLARIWLMSRDHASRQRYKLLQLRIDHQPFSPWQQSPDSFCILCRHDTTLSISTSGGFPTVRRFPDSFSNPPSAPLSFDRVNEGRDLAPSSRGSRLLNLPVEILIKVIGNFDAIPDKESLACLALVNRD